MKRSKRRLALLIGLFLILFLGLVLYLVFFQLVKAPALRANSLNMRNWVDETHFGRGRFYDRNGEELVGREKDEEGRYYRYANHPNMYSHVIGYHSDLYGKTGLEKALNSELLNLSTDNPIAALRGSVLNEGIGNDAVLTIDNDLQYCAYTAMEGHKGAAIAMDVKTGEILAMVSLPSFNVNDVDDRWNELIEDEGQVLFPRATLGRYTPGSVIKPITALALLREGVDLQYEDTGETTVNGQRYTNANGAVFGEIGLKEALMHSSNVYFVDKTKNLDPAVLREAMESVGFNQELPFLLPTAKSTANYKEGMDINLKVSDSFGQGDMLATPLQMTVAYAAFANGGEVLEPHIVKHFLSPAGEIIKPTKPTILHQISPSFASILREDLVATGDAIGLADAIGQSAGGKTGTAETVKDSTNAWTIGFAPADNPKVVVCVVMEDDGRTGREAAMPVVAEILSQALHQ
ncbi:peptidoglycan D,D-transpeptidase FtsI family protein [Murdochiella vaginalis]|uniref:peptidoglycan D,D-transpeptidase FtsI family protein n=1 Tax=Murdochiella vaginalis TaxID=1852373 RepID=UPI0008FDFDDA|nr:penicillin-binding transpeptidase domain-containing protein [Murdochiella vaginalis]